MADTIKDGTEKLYYGDAYATEFTAEVLSCTKAKDGYAVILDRTLFFPEEGGQSPDQGSIDGIAVTDVQIHDGIITHTLEKPLAEGSTVSGTISWEHRFSNMQQHSGEHLFSGLIHKKFGYDNVGFHLSDREVTLDFNGPVPDDEIQKTEEQVNEAIAKNFETVISYPTKEEEKAIDYRSKIEISGQTRLVSFPGYDTCACCAPHVKRTGEIGMLKVVSAQNYKGGVRISIVCGFRALALFQTEHEILGRTANYLTTSKEAVYDSVVRLKEENASLHASLQKAAAEKMQQMIRAVPEDKKNVCLFVQDADQKAVRDAVNLLSEQHDGFCAVFNGSREEGFSYIIGTKKGDAREIGNLLKEKFAARGGGKPEMIQGSVKAAASELEALF